MRMPSRAQRGDEELTSAPEITTIDSTVLDWDDRITRVALPWGLLRRCCSTMRTARRKA